jgi:hypothetical protein
MAIPSIIDHSILKGYQKFAIDCPVIKYQDSRHHSPSMIGMSTSVMLLFRHRSLDFFTLRTRVSTRCMRQHETLISFRASSTGCFGYEFPAGQHFANFPSESFRQERFMNERDFRLTDSVAHDRVVQVA